MTISQWETTLESSRERCYMQYAINKIQLLSVDVIEEIASKL